MFAACAPTPSAVRCLATARPDPPTIKLDSMRLCAITDGKRHANLVDLAANWAARGVDFIQLREKGADPRSLVSLARAISEKIDRSRTRLLVNVPSAEAASWVLEATNVDGVHIAGKPVPGAAGSVRQSFRHTLISLPCHNLDDVETARKEHADLILFSPIFGKLPAPPLGLTELAHACAAAQGIPVLALGGVNAANAPQCIASGAAGVAGIRLFAGDEWRQLTGPGLDI